MTVGPIQEDLRAQMNAIAEALDEVLNPGLKGLDREIGFAVFAFPFGYHDNARMNFITNTKRDDFIAALKEFLAREAGLVTETEEIQ